MKKYLALFLLAVMILALLISCTNPQDTDTNSSDSTSKGDTSSDSINSPEAPKDSHTKNPIKPTEKTHTATYQFNYSYYHVFETATNEPLAYLLIEHSQLGRGFDNVIIPDDITAGDTITIEYTGEIEELESYPGVKILQNGEVKSYSFGYAEVTHLEGSEFSIQKIKDCYDYKNAYVILDRSGKFVKLDDYTGTEIYLVTDQKELYGDDLGGIQDLKAPLKHPIACMLAYNPRDLEDGISEKTISELRNEKVTIDLDYQDMDAEENLEDISDNPSRRFAGYIGYNADGNQYIIYAPSYYCYSVTVFCKDSTADVLSLINQLLSASSFDLMELSGNGIGIQFPNFDEYSKVQEELLNSLSALNSVEKIHVSYLSPNSFVEELRNDIYTTHLVPINYESKLITSYEQFTKLFDLTDEKNTSISAITEEVFENNYILFISEFYYCSGVSSIAIKDARLVDKTLYLTKYEYFTGKHEQVTEITPALIIIPKTEFDAITDEEIKVNFVDIDFYIEKHLQ